MTPRASLWIAGGLGAAVSVAFANVVRLPLPFEGFAAAAAAGLAFATTLAIAAWMPERWLWTEAERLRRAFQDRHGLSGDGAENALEAITRAHGRARALRQAATPMREDVADRVTAVADRLDTAAREIFYTPERRRDLRAVLIRSELIEDAATAHAKLRGRDQAATEDASRAKLLSAVDALEAAFDETDLLAARGLLAEVEVASDVAESVLRPRRTHQD
ncbi:MAG: hypothetical protein AAF092_01200 [Pseudomonadota bacterium]